MSDPPSRAERMFRDRDRAEGRYSIADPAEGLRAFVEGEADPAVDETTDEPGAVPFDLPVIRRELNRLSATSPSGPDEKWRVLLKIVDHVDALVEVKHDDNQTMAGLYDILLAVHQELLVELSRHRPRSSED